MPKRLCIALCLFVSLTSFAQSPHESATGKSYARAREVLEAGIKAMGGLDALRSVNNISREMSGVRTKELGLAVEQIVPVHGQMGTLDNLRRAVERSKANK